MRYLYAVQKLRIKVFVILFFQLLQLIEFDFYITFIVNIKKYKKYT